MPIIHFLDLQNVVSSVDNSTTEIVVFVCPQLYVTVHFQFEWNKVLTFLCIRLAWPCNAFPPDSVQFRLPASGLATMERMEKSS